MNYMLDEDQFWFLYIFHSEVELIGLILQIRGRNGSCLFKSCVALCLASNTGEISWSCILIEFLLLMITTCGFIGHEQTKNVCCQSIWMTYIGFCLIVGEICIWANILLSPCSFIYFSGTKPIFEALLGCGINVVFPASREAAVRIKPQWRQFDNVEVTLFCAFMCDQTNCILFIFSSKALCTSLVP